MERVYRWTKRIAVTFAVTGGIVYVGWKGFRMITTDKGGPLDDHIAKKLDHYQRIQMNCMTAVRNLMSPSRDIVLSCLSTESIMSDLKDAKEQSVKILLWEKLKVISFTRAVVSACVFSLLIVLVRIQFSVMAAYLFSNKDAITEDVQRQYLSILHQSLQRGLPTLVQQVKSSAEEILRQYSLKQTVTVENIKEMILAVLDVTSSTNASRRGTSWLLNLTVPDRMGLSSHSILDQLLLATHDILEIEDTQVIVDSLVERAIHEETCIVTEAFHSAAQSSTSLPLAKVIPIVSDNAIVLLQSTRNRQSMLEEMINKDELMTLSRNCYEAFSE